MDDMLLAAQPQSDASSVIERAPVYVLPVSADSVTGSFVTKAVTECASSRAVVIGSTQCLLLQRHRAQLGKSVPTTACSALPGHTRRPHTVRSFPHIRGYVSPGQR